MQNQYGLYIYTYMHHPSIGALEKSSRAGCGICTVLRYTLRRSNQKRFDEAAAASSPVLATSSTLPKRMMNAEQSDDDLQLAKRLTELAQRDKSYGELDLGSIGHGRIVMRALCWEASGPRGSAEDMGIDIDTSVHNIIPRTDYFSLFFKSSCGSPLEITMSVLQDS